MVYLGGGIPDHPVADPGFRQREPQVLRPVKGGGPGGLGPPDPCL